MSILPDLSKAKPGSNGYFWAQQLAELDRTPKPRKPRAVASITGNFTPPTREGDVITLTLPLPPKELQPNRKTKLHHFKRASLTKSTRDAAAFIASMVRPEEPWKAARLDVSVWMANKMDRDGIIGWAKCIFDSLETAGVIQNDSGVTIGDVNRTYGKAAEGRREVQITITRVE